ncbi:hypothetical protein NDU88_009661 [Pleurodeles waltl]|uniref:Uncharacterized protein n=1 Tax=Pleurodeles waltl TaxID=8319 RepID=A0AAV7PTV6_PLEWA|nr:hypothetical protein NDU88_009661 [Pleurodeles waltl]
MLEKRTHTATLCIMSLTETPERGAVRRKAEKQSRKRCQTGEIIRRYSRRKQLIQHKGKLADFMVAEQSVHSSGPSTPFIRRKGRRKKRSVSSRRACIWSVCAEFSHFSKLLLYLLWLLAVLAVVDLQFAQLHVLVGYHW